MSDQDRAAILCFVIFFVVLIGGTIKAEIDKQKPDMPPPQIERKCP